MIARASGWLSQSMDAAVRWQLGTLPFELPDRGRESPVSPGEFWAESRIVNPRTVRAGPVTGRRRHGSVEIRTLGGPSAGPGTHPGSRKLMATMHARPDRRDLPFVLIIHGFAIPSSWREESQCRVLSARGAHAARLDQPFHLRRRVPKQRSGAGFLSSDPDHTRRAVRQSVEDAAAILAWARQNVSDRIAVLGVSLGGLVACLLAAHVELDALVAIAPLCDPARTLMQTGPRRMQRMLGLNEGAAGPSGDDRQAMRMALDAALAPLVPRQFTPATRPHRITLVRPQNDAIVGPEPIADLAATWGTELWDLRHGHISAMNARGLNARVQERLLNPRERAGVGLRLVR